MDLDDEELEATRKLYNKKKRQRRKNLMIKKYKVSKSERQWFKRRVIYCRIVAKQKMANGEAYVVKMINHYNDSGIYLNTDLQDLNIIDKIKIKIGEILCIY